MMLRAWHVFELDSYKSIVNSLLVFAETRNDARIIAIQHGPWDYESYLSVQAKRAKDWDEHIKFSDFDIIETNDDLPKDAPAFYDEVV